MLLYLLMNTTSPRITGMLQSLRTRKIIFGKGRQNPQCKLQYHIHQGRGKGSSSSPPTGQQAASHISPCEQQSLLPQLHYKEISELQFRASKLLKTAGLFFLSQNLVERPWADLSFHPRTASMLLQ